jgi:hypothetical protein
LSPVEPLTIERLRNRFRLRLKTRENLPAYPLRGYKLRGVFYGPQEVELPELAPGGDSTLDLIFQQSEAPVRVQFELTRPNGFSIYSSEWKP